MKEIVTDGTHIPEPVKQFPYWVLWDFDLKQPRAPWAEGHCYPAEWAQDKDNDPRTDFSSAKAAAELGPELLHESKPFPNGPPDNVGPTILLPHEGDDTAGPNPADPPLLFIDYDDVVVDGSVPPEVWDIAKRIGGPVFASRSTVYGDGAGGLHQLARGELPGGLVSIGGTDLDKRGHIEVYYRSRMTGLTFEHIRGSPTDDLPEASDAIDWLVDAYGSDSLKRRRDNDTHAATTTLSELTPKKELAEKKSTDKIQDIYDAVAQVTDRDISLRSTLTEESGRRSYDPSWERSNSGTRLGFDTLKDGSESFIYRAANQPIDALQVVAREEGIIMDVTDYPEGKDYWRAVNELRKRGASIPYFEGDNKRHPDYLRLFEEPETKDDEREQALAKMRSMG